MLAEVRQFRDPAEAQTQLAGLLKLANENRNFSSPILDWLQSGSINTPALVFDARLIEQRMQWLHELTRHLSITPLVAAKSCPAPEYLALGLKHLHGFDVSNPAEYAGLPERLDGKLVSVTAPDLRFDLGGFSARGNKTVVVLDSLTQLEHYFSQNPPFPYLLRIQGPDLMGHQSPPDPAYFPATRFGFSCKEVRQLFQLKRMRDNPPAGFHVHHGSERNQASTYKNIIGGLSELSRQLSLQPTCINIGGGWHSLPTDDIGDVLQSARSAFPQPCNILTEPGRWYAENAGFAVCTIVNQSSAGNVVKYTVDLSGRCHLHWSNVKLVHEIESGSNRACEAQFFGPSCFEGDRVGKFLLPYRNEFFNESGLVTGARVIFSGVSTYSLAWNTSFNGIPRADAIWWSP